MKKLLLVSALVLSFIPIANSQTITPYPATCVYNDDADKYIIGMLEQNTIIQNTITKEKGEKLRVLEFYTFYNFETNMSNFVLYTEENTGNRSACLLFFGESMFAGKK